MLQESVALGELKKVGKTKFEEKSKQNYEQNFQCRAYSVFFVIFENPDLSYVQSAEKHAKIVENSKLQFCSKK